MVKNRHLFFIIEEDSGRERVRRGIIFQKDLQGIAWFGDSSIDRLKREAGKHLQMERDLVFDEAPNYEFKIVSWGVETGIRYEIR